MQARSPLEKSKPKWAYALCLCMCEIVNVLCVNDRRLFLFTNLE